MDAQIEDWKHGVERLWAAPAFDFRAAAQLAAEIARASEEPTLRQRATSALPSLRAALAKSADRWSRDVAQRRFGAVRDCLHALSGPRFGKRGSKAATPTPEEHFRRVLGLPLGRRLFGPEIKEAYKRAAKRVHPDAGGSERAFQELSAARDGLMKRL
jgi:hypothetical protein